MMRTKADLEAELTKALNRIAELSGGIVAERAKYADLIEAIEKAETPQLIGEPDKPKRYESHADIFRRVVAERDAAQRKYDESQMVVKTFREIADAAAERAKKAEAAVKDALDRAQERVEALLMLW